MTDLVRYCPALGLAGLFRPLQAQRDRQPLTLTQDFNGWQWTWRAPEAPGVPEQTLLLILMGLAQHSERRLAAQPQTAIGRQLRDGLDANGDIFKAETVSLLTSLSELARLCGYAKCGGSNLSQVRRMLDRLAAIRVSVRCDNGYVASSRLLSVLVDDDGCTRLALNAQLARVAWGERQYVQVSLAERLALSTHAGQALHAYLSAAVRPGASRLCRWLSLEGYVWGERASGSAQRNRRIKLREALSEMHGRGWTVEDGAMVKVVRQSRGVFTA